MQSACTAFEIGHVDDRIEELNKVCGDAYKTHYECLDNHNQQFKDCRPAERGLNACVLAKMVRYCRSMLRSGTVKSRSWDTRRTTSIMDGSGTALWSQ